MNHAIGPKGLFVTGTDTGVGKTHVSCLIARQLIQSGLRVAIYKPVCSGALNSPRPPESSVSDLMFQWDDIERIKATIGNDWPDDIICPQRFLAPLAPPIAAKLEGRTVDFQRLVEGASSFHGQDLLLIEGVGGWLSPVTETQTVADLAVAFARPVLIVARPGLGTINQTLLTIESVRARRLTIAGVVLSEAVVVSDDDSTKTNSDEIEARSGIPVFGTIPHGGHGELLRDGKRVNVNWTNLAVG